MKNKIILNAPAKINLFLKILSKRKDNFHNIFSGITFVNLFDQISIKKSDRMKIYYYGPFKPLKGNYKNCIIKKTLKFLKVYNKINLEITIKKNIPTMAGLGSASTDAAALLKILNEMKVINLNNNYKFYSSLGADIPVFLHGKNSIVTGIGDQIEEYLVPKYYFLLVKPKINNSTKKMYELINDFDTHKKSSTIDPKGNDFEKIASIQNKKIKEILDFLIQIDNSIFSGMTGSGSCCFATFKKQKYALMAQNIFKANFPSIWSYVAENNLTL